MEEITIENGTLLGETKGPLRKDSMNCPLTNTLIDIICIVRKDHYAVCGRVVLGKFINKVHYLVIWIKNFRKNDSMKFFQCILSSQAWIQMPL